MKTHFQDGIVYKISIWKIIWSELSEEQTLLYIWNFKNGFLVKNGPNMLFFTMKYFIKNESTRIGSRYLESGSIFLLIGKLKGVSIMWSCSWLKTFSKCLIKNFIFWNYCMWAILGVCFLETSIHCKGTLTSLSTAKCDRLVLSREKKISLPKIKV